MRQQAKIMTFCAVVLCVIATVIPNLTAAQAGGGSGYSLDRTVLPVPEPRSEERRVGKECRL